MGPQPRPKMFDTQIINHSKMLDQNNVFLSNLKEIKKTSLFTLTLSLLAVNFEDR